jgi:hypothetical protein
VYRHVTADDLTVTHDDITVLTGNRDLRKILWTALAFNARAALFSPTLSTMRPAIARNIIPEFPGLSAASLWPYLLN